MTPHESTRQPLDGDGLRVSSRLGYGPQDA
jgi:hypothetical protein